MYSNVTNAVYDNPNVGEGHYNEVVGYNSNGAYTLNSPACHLLSLVSGVPENYIRNAQIMQRGLGHYYPLYSSNDGGGAIILYRINQGRL